MRDLICLADLYTISPHLCDIVVKGISRILLDYCEIQIDVHNRPMEYIRDDLVLNVQCYISEFVN
jgi:hypothetical protein